MNLLLSLFALLSLSLLSHGDHNQLRRGYIPDKRDTPPVLAKAPEGYVKEDLIARQKEAVKRNFLIGDRERRESVPHRLVKPPMIPYYEELAAAEQRKRGLPSKLVLTNSGKRNLDKYRYDLHKEDQLKELTPEDLARLEIQKRDNEIQNVFKIVWGKRDVLQSKRDSLLHRRDLDIYLNLDRGIGKRDSFRDRFSIDRSHAGAKRGFFGTVSDILQTPFDVASAVISVPFEVAGKVVEAVKPIAGDTLAGMAQKQLDVWGGVFQLPLEMGSDFAKLPFELIASIGEDKEGHGGLQCCVEVPELNEMMDEVEKIHSVIKNCSATIGAALMGGVAQQQVRQARGLFSSDSALYDLITKPIAIASSVAQLPFKVIGEGIKIPLKLAQTVVNAASPLLGDRLSSILSVPLDTLSKFAQLPFEIGAEFIQMPFGVAEDLAKLPFGSEEEAAAAKYCCGRMNAIEGMLASLKQVIDESTLCNNQLDQVLATLDEVQLTAQQQPAVVVQQPAAVVVQPPAVAVQLPAVGVQVAV